MVLYVELDKMECGHESQDRRVREEKFISSTEAPGRMMDSVYIRNYLSVYLPDGYLSCQQSLSINHATGDHHTSELSWEHLVSFEVYYLQHRAPAA